MNADQPEQAALHGTLLALALLRTRKNTNKELFA
jgi:hypothetical protein